MKKLFKKYLKSINYRITDSTPFLWKCYGNTAHIFSFDCEDFSASIVIDMKDQTVYEMEIFTNTSDLRWINPDYKKAYKKEAKKRKVKWNQAWDDVEFQEVDDPKVILKEIKKYVDKEIMV